jgi:putative hydrolase of the HAD superfamily
MTEIDVLYLDVDHTLYPDSCGLWSAVKARIEGYIENQVGLKGTEGKTLRHRFLQQYGTTLRGLQMEYEVDTEDYLDYVHDVPVEQLLEPDPALRELLLAVRPQIFYFTNAYRPYTERVLKQLGVLDLGFEIIDIRAMEFENKPLPGAYRRALQIAGNPSPDHCAIVDDLPANLLPADALGMETVLVSSQPDSIDGADHIIAKVTDLFTAMPNLRRG